MNFLISMESSQFTMRRKLIFGAVCVCIGVLAFFAYYPFATERRKHHEKRAMEFFRHRALPEIRNFVRLAQLPLASHFPTNQISFMALDTDPSTTMSHGFVLVQGHYEFRYCTTRLLFYSDWSEDWERQVLPPDDQNLYRLRQKLLSLPEKMTKEAALQIGESIFQRLGYRPSDYLPPVGRQAGFHDLRREFVDFHSAEAIEQTRKSFLANEPIAPAAYLTLPCFVIRWDGKGQSQVNPQRGESFVEMHISGAGTNLVRFRDSPPFWTPTGDEQP